MTNPVNGDTTTTHAAPTAATEATPRQVAFASGAQLGAKGAHLLLNVASTLIVVRYLPEAAFGEYVVVLSTVMLAGLVGEFGLPTLAVREIVRRPEHRDEILGTVVVLRLSFTVVATGLIQLVLLAIGASSAAHLAALIASASLIFDAFFTLIVVTHAAMRQHLEALLRLAMETVEVIVLVALVAAGASLPMLFVAPVVGALAGALGAFAIARRTFGVAPRLSKAHARPLLREAAVIGPTVIIGVAYLKSDGLILAARRPSVDVAHYGAAAQPIEYLFLSSAVVVGVVFPLLARAFGSGDTRRFQATYRSGTELLFIGCLLVPLTVALCGTAMLEVAFAGKYNDAAVPFLVLSVAFVLMVSNAWRSFVLLAAGQQVATLRYDLVACVVALVAGFSLVGPYGATGAAAATLCVAVVVAVLSLVAVRRRVEVTLRPAPLMIAAGAAAGAGGLGASTSAIGAGPFVQALTAIAAYVLFIVAFARPSFAELVGGADDRVEPAGADEEASLEDVIDLRHPGAVHPAPPVPSDLEGAVGAGTTGVQ
ncbi:MAG: oligosaccharide flippase family protein [Microthrixaceae bacterium]|nr:oligosaccharide flippase family protein [Microthrixaceae bacterium]